MQTNSASHPVDLTVDVVIFTVVENDLKVLLIQRPVAPYRGLWALPGGFLQSDEPAQASAERVLEEKTGISGVYMEQLYTFDAIDRDPRGRTVSICYFALVPHDRLTPSTGHDIQNPTLTSLKNLPKLAFDHSQIVEYARLRLQSKLEYTNVVFSLLPGLFTFSQLQKIYETILDRPLDKRNFQKKYLSLGLIEQTDQLVTGARHRPARLYRFSQTQPAQLKKFF